MLSLKRDRLERQNSIEQQKTLKGPELGVIFTQKDLKLQMYPNALRKKQACRRVCNVFVHLLLTLYIGVLIWAFWRSWAIDCIR